MAVALRVFTTDILSNNLIMSVCAVLSVQAVFDYVYKIEDVLS